MTQTTYLEYDCNGNTWDSFLLQNDMLLTVIGEGVISNVDINVSRYSYTMSMMIQTLHQIVELKFLNYRTDSTQPKCGKTVMQCICPEGCVLLWDHQRILADYADNYISVFDLMDSQDCVFVTDSVKI